MFACGIRNLVFQVGHIGKQVKSEQERVSIATSERANILAGADQHHPVASPKEEAKETRIKKYTLFVRTSGGKRSRTINQRARTTMKKINLRLMLIDHPFLLNYVDIKTNP